MDYDIILATEDEKKETKEDKKQVYLNKKMKARIIYIIKNYDDGTLSEYGMRNLPIQRSDLKKRTLSKNKIKEFCEYTVTNLDYIYLKSDDDLFQDENRAIVTERSYLHLISNVLYSSMGYDVNIKGVYMLLNIIIPNFCHLSGRSEFYHNSCIQNNMWMNYYDKYLITRFNDEDKYNKFMDQIEMRAKEYYNIKFYHGYNKYIYFDFITKFLGALVMVKPVIHVL